MIPGSMKANTKTTRKSTTTKRRPGRRNRVAPVSYAARWRGVSVWPRSLPTLWGVKPTLRFSPGKRMDDGEEVVQYSASGAPVAADDVLFSGASAARPAEDDVLFSGASAVRPGDFDPYDPLLNGHSIAEPVSAAAAATAAPQAWAESPVGHHGAAPAYQPEASYPPQQAYQPEPAPFQQAAYQPPAGQTAPQSYQPEPAPYQQPVYDPRAGQPAPQAYQPEPAAYQPQSASVPPPEPEPEVVQEEVKRPPLYYFEEVEEKRARERELLASWYQPIPEPESPIATKPLTPPTTASKPPVETTVVSAVAAGVHQATAPAAARRQQPRPLRHPLRLRHCSARRPAAHGFR
ncbi:cell division protein [Klebsiella pneumoniae]|nr:cell division protein [Klebsiella pneumoniae]